MFIPSNDFIYALLTFSPEKLESICHMLNPEQGFSDGVEPINPMIKKAIHELGYPMLETTDHELYLIELTLTLLENNTNLTIRLVILTRLLSAYRAISNEHHHRAANLISTHLQEQYTALNLFFTQLNPSIGTDETPHTLTSDQNQTTYNPAGFEAEIITQLIQNPSTVEKDCAHKASLLETLFTHTIDKPTQNIIINTIIEQNKTHPECLHHLKKMINYYLTSDKDRLAKAKAIRDNNTSMQNALIFIEHIGQTGFKIHRNGHFLKTFDKYAKGQALAEEMHTEFGLFREPRPSNTTPSNPFTPTPKIC